jgi:hypothetical protein
MTSSGLGGSSVPSLVFCFFVTFGVLGDDIEFVGRLADFGVAVDFLAAGFLAGVMRSFIGIERIAGKGGGAASPQSGVDRRLKISGDG